jgi:predicted Zn-dependent protease
MGWDTNAATAFIFLLMLNGLSLEGVPPASMEDSGPAAENLTPGGYWQAQLTPNGAASVLLPSIAHVDFSRRDAKETRIDPASVAIQRSPSVTSVKSPTSRGFQLLRWRGITVPSVAGDNGQRSPPSRDASSADKQYALTLIDAGKFKEAIDRLQVLKKTSPSDISIQVALVDAYFKAGIRSGGERETQEALGSSTLSETAGLALAKVLVEDKQGDTAQRVLEQLAVKWPESAESHGELGLLLSAKSQFERATWELGRAVQLKPDSVGYVQALAEVLLSWRHYATALDFVTAEEQRFGKLPDLEYCLAFSLYGLRRHNEAFAILDKLLEQYPRFDRAYFLVGNCYVSLGDSQKAVASFTKAFQLNPRNPSYYFAIADVLRRNPSKAEEAIAYARKGLGLDPTSSDGKIQLALCYESKKEFSRARVLLEEVTQAHPELIPPHRILARVYYQQGNVSEANHQTKIAATLEAHHLKPSPGSASPPPTSEP